MISNFILLLNILIKKEKLELIYNSFLVLIISVLEILNIYFLYELIGLIEIKNNNNLFEVIFSQIPIYSNFNLIFKSAILFIGFTFLKFILTGYIYKTQSKFLKNIVIRIGGELLENFLLLEYEEFIKIESSKYIKSLTQELNNFFNFCLMPSLIIFSETVTLLIIFCGLIYIKFKITISILIFFIGFYFIFFRKLKKIVLNLGNKNQSLNQTLINATQELFNGKREIILYNLESIYHKKIKNNIFNLYSGISENLFLSNIPRIFLDFTFFVIFGIVLLFISNNDSNNFFQTLTIFAAAGLRLLPSVNKLLSSFTSLNFGKASLNSIIDDLNRKNIFKKKLNKKKIVLRDKLEIKNLTYKYENQNKLFENLNLRIHFNSTNIILGASGSGKTTLIHIILGLFKIKNGIINIGESKVDLNNNGWFQNVGYLPQKIFIMNDTILNNIILNPEKKINNKKLNKVLNLSGLTDLIEKKEEGLKFNCGENGIKLSGGEIQRIGIARLLYNDKKILIFDEPTSALNKELSFKIINTIFNLKNIATIIVITHDNSFINYSDHLFQLENKSLIQVR